MTDNFVMLAGESFDGMDSSHGTLQEMFAVEKLLIISLRGRTSNGSNINILSCTNSTDKSAQVTQFGKCTKSVQLVKEVPLLTEAMEIKVLPLVNE